MARTTADTRESPEGPRGGEQERRPRSPVLAVALLVSVLVHLVLVLLYPVWMERLRPEAVAPVPPESVRPDGTEIVAIREIAAPDEEQPEPQPEPEEPREVPVAPAEPGVETRPTEPEPEAPELTPAERLRPNEENVRLWTPPDRALTDLTPEERLQLEIETAIEAWNDSVNAAGERARAATDWTSTDDQGNRWGISPGKIHLGKVTLPLPFYFGPANGVQRDEMAKRAYELGDIERAAQQGLVRETLEERARAMRARKDAERAARQAAEANADGATNGDAPPDTTRNRR